MTEQAGRGAGSFPEDADPSWRALYRLATIAWMAIVLGLVIQALILAGKLASGGSFPGPSILADMAQGVTWSLIVCLGVGIGAMVMRASLTLAGFIGFVAAPLGLGAAKGVQQGINQLIDTPQSAVSVALLVVAAIKAFEYGFLTYRLTGMVREQRGHLRPYLVLGLGTGAVFGGLIVLVTWQFTRLAGSSLALPGLVGLGINELLFPAGCALVIFAIQYIGGHVRAIEAKTSAAK